MSTFATTSTIKDGVLNKSLATYNYINSVPQNLAREILACMANLNPAQAMLGIPMVNCAAPPATLLISSSNLKIISADERARFSNFVSSCLVYAGKADAAKLRRSFGSARLVNISY